MDTKQEAGLGRINRRDLAKGTREVGRDVARMAAMPSFCACLSCCADPSSGAFRQLVREYRNRRCKRDQNLTPGKSHGWL